MQITLRIFYDAGTDAAIIAGSSQLASTALGAMAQNNINNDMKEYNREMYAMQRKDALADWNANNAYNSPEAQMERFKKAGLNPNLIYGNNSTNAAPIRASTMGSYNPKAPDLSGIAQGMGNAMSVALQQRQLRNMDAQQALTLAQSRNTDASTAEIQARTPGYDINQQSNQLDLDLKKNNYNIIADKILQDWKTSVQNQEIASAQNIREEKKLDLSFKQFALQKLTTELNNSTVPLDQERIRQQIKSLKMSNQVDAIDLKFKKLYNINKNDGLPARMATWIYEQLFGSSDNNPNNFITPPKK